MPMANEARRTPTVSRQERRHLVSSPLSQSSVLSPQSSATTASSLARFDACYFKRSGVHLLAGIDEAGRGALAGPVVAAAVVMDAACQIEGLNDSKQLSPAQRERLYGAIHTEAKAVAVGWASAQEIDRLNVLRATHLAAHRAFDALPVRPDYLLTDWLKLKDVPVPLEAMAKGDARSQAIAAASVIAKVTRDRWLRRLDTEYPQYSFAVHKGYGVPAHLGALREHGPSTIHRHSFRGVDLFDTKYRVSLTLANLLQRVREGELAGREPEEVWLEQEYMLPECEFETFCRAMNEERRSGNSELE
jgi:ribonuclease HII